METKGILILCLVLLMIGFIAGYQKAEIDNEELRQENIELRKDNVLIEDMLESIIELDRNAVTYP